MIVKHRSLTLPERTKIVLPASTIIRDSTLNGLYLGDGETVGGIAISDPVALQGPTTVPTGVPVEYVISNYDRYSSYYAVDSSGVPLPIVDGRVEYTPPNQTNDYFDVYRNGVGRRFAVQVELDTGPGPTQLIGGDLTAGFYGETDAGELITGDVLASAIGLIAGTAQFSNESWLKFALDDRILFVAKRPLRHTISWNAINAVNAVYGREDDAEVVIDERRYRVRLLKGADVDPTNTPTNTYNPVGTHLSEWNRLMYPIHSGIHTNSNNPVLPEMGTWAQYSDEDLHVHNSYGDGALSWCQETDAGSSVRRARRGSLGITRFDFSSSSSLSYASSGWRPCLELITD